MEKVYLIFAVSFDSEPRVRFVSNTKDFTSNIKEAKVMTSDEAYEAYCRLNVYYRLNVIETTRSEFSELKWNIQDNCSVNEIPTVDFIHDPEEYLKPKTYDWIIHYNNKFYYCTDAFIFENEYFMPNKVEAKLFHSKTETEMLSIVGKIQSKFRNVKLEVVKL